MALRTEGAAKFIASGGVCWHLSRPATSTLSLTYAVRALLVRQPQRSLHAGGYGHNLLWVTLGNTLSGAVFMGWVIGMLRRKRIVRLRTNLIN